MAALIESAGDGESDVTTAENWDLECDVVVAGSGGAGLTAAILAHDQGAKAVVLERSDKVGGTTAVSGGGVWLPMNHHMGEIAANDPREAAPATTPAKKRKDASTTATACGGWARNNRNRMIKTMSMNRNAMPMVEK